MQVRRILKVVGGIHLQGNEHTASTMCRAEFMKSFPK